MTGCYYCGATSDLRPYGPEGSWVCFPCATTPERNTESQARFGALLDANEAISPSGATLLTPLGPQPFDPEILK